MFWVKKQDICMLSDQRIQKIRNRNSFFHSCSFIHHRKNFIHPVQKHCTRPMSAVPVVFSLALTLSTFILVAVVACFNSWDHIFFTFFKSLQPLCFGVRFRA